MFFSFLRVVDYHSSKNTLLNLAVKKFVEVRQFVLEYLPLRFPSSNGQYNCFECFIYKKLINYCLLFDINNKNLFQVQNGKVEDEC